MQGFRTETFNVPLEGENLLSISSNNVFFFLSTHIDTYRLDDETSRLGQLFNDSTSCNKVSLRSSRQCASELRSALSKYVVQRQIPFFEHSDVPDSRSKSLRVQRRDGNKREIQTKCDVSKNSSSPKERTRLLRKEPIGKRLSSLFLRTPSFISANMN